MTNLPTAFTIPTAKEINALHSRSDVDTDATAQHHTLGTRNDQASPGSHDHDGTNSKTLVGTPSNVGSNTFLLSVDKLASAAIPDSYQQGISLMVANTAGSPAWPAVPSMIVTTKIGTSCSQECRALNSNTRYYRTWDAVGSVWRAWV